MAPEEEAPKTETCLTVVFLCVFVFNFCVLMHLLLTLFSLVFLLLPAFFCRVSFLNAYMSSMCAYGYVGISVILAA